ncbi:hypothetical protein JYT74_03335 [Crocinitomix catalasitica]|nr:hypothetical protein [Crocinitomix catalasitica]
MKTQLLLLPLILISFPVGAQKIKVEPNYFLNTEREAPYSDMDYTPFVESFSLKVNSVNYSITANDTGYRSWIIKASDQKDVHVEFTETLNHN